MAINAFQNVTPGAKLALVNNKLGNPSLKKNQGSSVEIYDYVEIASPGTAETIRFFQDVNSHAWPFSNINQNQLQVGEALAIEYIFFTRMVTETNSAGVTKIVNWNALLNNDSLTIAQFNFLLDNSRIIKNNSLSRTNSEFNVKGATSNNFVFYPDTDLTIPPQISFIGELRIPANSDAPVEGKKVYYGCHLLGTGAILNLKTNV